MESLFKTKWVLCALFLSISSLAVAQQKPFNEFRKISLTINGGASLGDTNRNEYFLSSNFSTNTKDTPTFGLGVQYALTPIWSLELGYQRTQIRGLEQPFETNVNQITFRNIINLNQLLLINAITERFNPFVTAGVGYDIYNYQNSSESISNNNSSYNLGAGLAYKLTNAVDLFSHYDFHIGSNEMDNETEGWGSDLINALTVGIRLNFGKGDAIHPSWKPYPANLSNSDYDKLMAQAERINNLDAKLDELEKRSDHNDQQHEIAIDSLKIRMDILEQRMGELEKALASLKGTLSPVSVNKETGTATLLPAGHYVQIFASYGLPNAQTVRNHALKSLDNSLQDAEEKIFIIKRKQFHEVLIGMLSDFSDAATIQEIMTGFHEDAYIISFPRPVNLTPDFEGLKVVD